MPAFQALGPYSTPRSVRGVPVFRSSRPSRRSGATKEEKPFTWLPADIASENRALPPGLRSGEPCRGGFLPRLGPGFGAAAQIFHPRPKESVHFDVAFSSQNPPATLGSVAPNGIPRAPGSRVLRASKFCRTKSQTIGRVSRHWPERSEVSSRTSRPESSSKVRAPTEGFPDPEKRRSPGRESGVPPALWKS